MDYIELHGNRVYMGARPLFFNPEYELYAELEQRYVPALLGEGVRTVAVLMPMEEIQRHYGRDLLDLYRGYGLEVLWYPIEDFHAPEDMDTFHEFIGGYLDAAVRAGHVYVHCSAGIGRTGLAVAALLIYNGEGVEGAVRQVRAARPGTIETSGQLYFLQEYREFLAGLSST